MAMDAQGRIYLLSRFEGTAYRVNTDGTFATFATDLDIACRLAFSQDGTLFVGDRSGTIFRVDQSGKSEVFASVPCAIERGGLPPRDCARRLRVGDGADAVDVRPCV